jgi:hypothetical protein
MSSSRYHSEGSQSDEGAKEMTEMQKADFITSAQCLDDHAAVPEAQTSKHY